MKKIITLIIFIICFIFILINLVNINNNRYVVKMYKDIRENTNIKDIEYLNKYNNYYIVKDKYYIYVLNMNYNNILKEDVNNIHTSNYDMIYVDNELKYISNKKSGKKLTISYYNVYTYELENKITLGG